MGSRARTLKEKRVVLTGSLTVPRSEAKRLVRRVGRETEDRVSHRTNCRGRGTVALEGRKEARSCLTWNTSPSLATL